jgi:hypothetical protein
MCIELPSAAGAPEGVCGKLVLLLYGFCPAAQACENQNAEHQVSFGFSHGEASPVSFFREDIDVSCLVHGYDFTFVGEGGLDT